MGRLVEIRPPTLTLTVIAATTTGTYGVDQSPTLDVLTPGSKTATTPCDTTDSKLVMKSCNLFAKSRPPGQGYHRDRVITRTGIPPG